MTMLTENTTLSSTNTTPTTPTTTTTTFKVVEFYRNTGNNNNNNFNNTLNTTTNSLNVNDAELLVTTSPNSNINNNNNNIYNTLGFNVIGGYLTDIPATIIDIAAPTQNPSKLNTRIEEGDIILEINGVSSRHLTLAEVYKQLRCCGNRIRLKLKSDPNHKQQIVQRKQDFVDLFTTDTPLDYEAINNALKRTAAPPKTPTLATGLVRNASKSYDSNINNAAAALVTNSIYKAVNGFASPSVSLDQLSTSAAEQHNGGYHHEHDNYYNDQEINNHYYSEVSTTTTTTTTTMVIANNKIHQNGNSLPMIQQQQQPSQQTTGLFHVEIDDSIKRKIDEKLKECSSGDSDSDSEINAYLPKAVDMPSAQRLAKRLYYLDGFKANDVVRHLSKKNDFSQLVADEYLKLFNFQSLTLDTALRKFLKQFQLVGDAQEKERVLMYFAKRYVDANNTAFTDVDSCHTLTCAIMLLNTDLHDPKIHNKMTLTEFIENLKGLNNGGNFSDILLESLYSAIKNEPLECACLGLEESHYYDASSVGAGGALTSSNGGDLLNGAGSNYTSRPIGCNPFLQLPDPQTAKEYKCGWLLRKCCIESDGKKAAFLKRSWKMFYASLRDMVLYLHKDDKCMKSNAFDNITNAIRIHHAYATVANDYKKKQFVFRLKTADWAEYLFQTSNSTELQDWVYTINLVAGMFSAPSMPGGIGSSKTFQRPLMPATKTRYSLQEQYDYQKKHIKQLQADINRLESGGGGGYLGKDDKSSKEYDKDKYNYLKFEIQRYTAYSTILEEKLLTESSATPLLPAPSPTVFDNIAISNGNGGYTYHHQHQYPIIAVNGNHQYQQQHPSYHNVDNMTIYSTANNKKPTTPSKQQYRNDAIQHHLSPTHVNNMYDGGEGVEGAGIAHHHSSFNPNSIVTSDYNNTAAISAATRKYYYD